MLLPWRRSGVRKRLALASLLLLCCARCSAYVSLPPEVAGAVTQLGTSLAGGGAAAPAPQPQPAPGGSGFGNVNAALGLRASVAAWLRWCYYRASLAVRLTRPWLVAPRTVGFLQLQSNLTDIDRLAVRLAVLWSRPLSP